MSKLKDITGSGRSEWSSWLPDIKLKKVRHEDVIPFPDELICALLNVESHLRDYGNDVDSLRWNVQSAIEDIAWRAELRQDKALAREVNDIIELANERVRTRIERCIESLKSSIPTTDVVSRVQSLCGKGPLSGSDGTCG
jgi:hypothetical protein